jgi:S1-C subfamily serine protease
MLSSGFKMRLGPRVIAVAIGGLAVAAASLAGDFRFVRSLSGPSGKVEGSRYVFDEVRNRFVLPQDKVLIVYFEWEGPPGPHVLTGLWRRPDGQVDSISADVRIEPNSRDMACYWHYTLSAETMPGVWALEVRIDGQPSGSHSFEIAGTAPPSRASEAPPKPPSLDRIFRAVSPSLVWVRKYNAAHKYTDTASGFVAGKDHIMTALQAVDGASRLEVEFAGGRKSETDRILAWSRSGDWAVVSVSTGDLPALQPGDPKLIQVGERLIVFNVEGGTKAIGGVDISGRRNVPGFGERIQFSPAISSEAAGGPLFDLHGRVAGILGGNVIPGNRFDPRHMSVNPALGILTGALNAATPVPAIPAQLPEKASSLSELVAAGVLTAPVSEMDGLIYVTTANEMTKAASDPLPRDVWEFSRRDKQVWVISEWQKRGRVSKGLLAAKVYDGQNRVRVVVQPKKVSLYPIPLRSGIGFSPESLNPGIYRIDLLWDDQPVWRTFIRVAD